MLAKVHLVCQNHNLYVIAAFPLGQDTMQQSVRNWKLSVRQWTFSLENSEKTARSSSAQAITLTLPAGDFERN